MNKNNNASRLHGGKKRFPVCAVSAVLASLATSSGVQAFQVTEPGSDWNIRWDNTLSYNLGFRARDIAPKIGNNPTNNNSDYKFSDRGDVVTNRFALLTEMDATWQEKYGFRVSASAWNDFAYDNDVERNPNLPANFTGRTDGKYSSTTEKYYMRGGEILDAFVFTNFDVGSMPSSLRAGRQTVYWGGSLYHPNLGISYSQGPIDGIKGGTSPGLTSKELFLPRNQVFYTTQLADELSLSAQYFLEFRPMRLPEGGTYLATSDFLFKGPNQLAGAGIPRGKDFEPDDRNDNFGVALQWSPQALRGSLGVYYRQFDEVMPWVALFGRSPTSPAPTNYHLSYAEKTKLIGLSLDKVYGSVSTAVDLSYRMDTALNNATGPTALDFLGKDGPRGDTWNLVANASISMKPTFLWDTGTVTAEVGYTRLEKVTEREDLYKGVGYVGCNGTSPTAVNAHDDATDGCSTRDQLSVVLAVTPQWFSVLPSVDLEMPIILKQGLHGNAPGVGAASAGAAEDTTAFSVGLKATAYRIHSLSVAYIGQRGKTGRKATGPAGEYTATGNQFQLNDRDWLSLTYQVSF